VIPAVAIAKISARLVVGQDPEKVGMLIGNFLKQNLPKGLELKVELHHGGMPMRISSDTPIAQISAKAYEEVFGEPCKFLLCGATVPIVTDLAEASQAQPALIGVSLAEDDINAPNEHFGLDQFEQGFLTMGRILGMLSLS
jgi:acetylornithine deacetylase/succinyl-diaminopimelate desuccinylase-like protein